MATKIYCASIECEYNDPETGRCKAKTVCISSHSIMTVYDGRQDFHRCKTFQLSEQARQMKEAIEKMFKERQKKGSAE